MDTARPSLPPASDRHVGQTREQSPTPASRGRPLPAQAVSARRCALIGRGGLSRARLTWLPMIGASAPSGESSTSFGMIPLTGAYLRAMESAPELVLFMERMYRNWEALDAGVFADAI